ncbi:MAG: hypothetical protein ACXWUD_01795 [Methylosarcina sp.]
MKNLLVFTTIVLLTACSDVSTRREQSVTVAPARKQPVAGTAPTASDGLSDLKAMTFSCPQAGLNAAAREAVKVPAVGSYQFSYFRIINDSDHSLYEIHFKSNYEAEADLKYCVSVYCQQGHKPTPLVSLMSNKPRPSSASAGGMALGADCGGHPAHAQGPKSKYRLKKQ